ncbi:MAG: hypothetical protein ACU843_14985 [Gammaproteobacteria bacterium]
MSETAVYGKASGLKQSIQRDGLSETDTIKTWMPLFGFWVLVAFCYLMYCHDVNLYA